MMIIPCFGDGADVPPPPPPPPKDTDPAIKESQDKLRLSEKRRKGRSAAILTGADGDLGPAPLARPEARGAALLGD